MEVNKKESHGIRIHISPQINISNYLLKQLSLGIGTTPSHISSKWDDNQMSNIAYYMQTFPPVHAKNNY